MKMYNASVLYVLLLLLLTCVDSRSTSQISFLSKGTNNTDPEISKNVTIDKDTSNFNDNMNLMNFTKFLQSRRSTTIQSITDEATYFEWGEQWPRLTLDGITTPTFRSTRGIDYNPTILDKKRKYFVPYSGNQGEAVKKINNEGWEQLVTHIRFLEHRETYDFTERNASMNQNASLYLSYEKVLLESEENSPPWMKYEPMQLRDEAGQKFVLNNLSDQYRFPESRDRWWWEYEMHYMHWFFWHCEHWMIHWKIHPPNPLLFNSKQEDYQDYETYGKSLEYKLHIYCYWLLQGKINQTNSEDGKNLKTVNNSLARSVDGNILRQNSIITKGPVVSQCYGCGDKYVDLIRQFRICHRAFTHEKYFKFQKWMKHNCRESLTLPKTRSYFRSVLYDNGTADRWGFFLKNKCATYFTDIGELYTVRSCMRLLPYRKSWYPLPYLQEVYYALDEVLREKNEVGCVGTPYAFFAPFSRSKPGLFVRSYACMCQGDYCNSSSKVQHFIVMPCILLFYLTLVVYRCIVCN